jgi:hypothetical protein
MNRSILIVICDFLLVSLLTFSTDLNHIASENTSGTTQVEVRTNEIGSAGADLANAMKLALTEERQNREQLQQQLATPQATTSTQQAQLSRQQIEAAQRTAENSRLQQQFSAAQTNAAALQQQLQQSAAQARQAEQRFTAAQSDAQKQNEMVAALRKQLEELSRTNQLAQSEKQQLATQLEVAEVEKRAAADRAALALQQVQAERVQTAQLAEGFKALATNSVALRKEIVENRPLAPNTIFSSFLTNRIQASLTASRTGFLHISSTKYATASTVLVTDSTNTFAVCHVQDTPLSLWDPGTDWDSLTGALTHGIVEVAIRSILFHRGDPRVVMYPVSADEARRLGSQIYRLSMNPYNFQDAVIVGADTGYYGQCDFQIQPDQPQYLKLDRSLLRGLVGKFNPSRGDLVFSRTGELLGLMVNDTYCLMLRDFSSIATLACGNNVRGAHTGQTLSQLYGWLYQLPMRLQ